jgi:hypothetical protein
VIIVLLKAGADAKTDSGEHMIAYDYAKDRADLRDTDALRLQ